MFNEIVKNFEVNQRKESEFYSLQFDQEIRWMKMFSDKKFLFRIREHSYDQMQIDLHHQKIFDLTIHFNQLDLSFPHPSKFNKTNKDYFSFDQIFFNYFSFQSSMRFQLKNLSLQTIFQTSSQVNSSSSLFFLFLTDISSLSVQNCPSNAKEFYQKYQMKFHHLKIISSSPSE